MFKIFIAGKNVHQMENPSPKVYGNLDLWTAYNRNPAKCAIKDFVLRIESGSNIPQIMDNIPTDGQRFS